MPDDPNEPIELMPAAPPPPPRPEPAAPEPPEEETWPPAGEVSRNERTTAMLALIFAGITFLVPLIIFLIKKDESKFVAFHSLQGLLLSLAVVLAILITCGLLSPLVWPAGVVIGIIWGTKANGGEWAELPVVGGWARQGTQG